ncbi:sigma-54 interaction domain-containing protein [Haloimpatiens sp. FM7330]|uniref:sigma-54 interaction domain-containing protein n=1 Tax=Haloimpatiens sp. FM7330 TaxID=3298610 RepID=UPI0036373D3B
MDFMKIVSSVQNICEAISSVLKIDVTIVDDKLNRIGGTGRYSKCIGERVTGNSAFGFTLKKGESFIIENPGSHPACLKCDCKEDCKEYAEVCCPIKINNDIVGVIGLIAFEEEQRDTILKNEENLMTFLNRMADLISSKLLEMENTNKIKLLLRELEIVLNSVDRGVIACDSDGNILHYNKKALKLFQVDKKQISNMNIRDFIGDINISKLIQENVGIKNKQFRYKNDHHRFRGIFDGNPITIGDKSFGIVFTFSNIKDVINIVNDVTIANIITSFDDIIGTEGCLKEVKIEAQKAAKSSSTVLVLGESGTGKELFARAIHFESDRAKKPFIPINCAAIPEQLLESELFGYEEGAFSGAKRGGKTGKFELANKGTIFLDEIGDMPIHLQTKLLRVLQDRVVERVGGKEFIPIDVRVIAATNKDLENKVLEGEFRQDLFYRLNVIPLNVPPLRERKEDIPILVQYLLNKCNKKLEKNIENFDYNSLEIFMNYDWPGNVRELENTIEYAVNMCSGNLIRDVDLPNRLKNVDRSVAIPNFTEIIPIKDLEKGEIIKAIKHFGGTKQAITKAAEALGISRATMYRKIKEYEVKI